MKLGVHLSIAGSILNALRDAKEIQANTIQIFSSPPRNWKNPNIKEVEIKKFKKIAFKNHISPIFIHAKYLVNLASNNKEVVKKSVGSLTVDLNLAEKIKAKGVIFHPRFNNIRLLTKNIQKVLSATNKSTVLILENSAQTDLKNIGKLINQVKNIRLNFCLDTAHAFEFGYNLKTKVGVYKLINLINKEIGLKKLALIHTNDSKTKFASKHDIHADLGTGELGLKPFKILLHHPAFNKTPFILETPGFRQKKLEGDLRNLNILKRLAGIKN